MIEEKCNYCTKKGHKEEECRKKKRDSDGKKPKKNDKGKKSQNEEKKAKNWTLCVTDQSPVGAQMDLIANCGADSTNRFTTIEG